MTDFFSPSRCHGWLALDKPSGLTSAQVVAGLRKALGVKKIGHAGTLDPLATGLLPLAVGEATKTVSLVQHRLKTYFFTVFWGEERSTGDQEGTVTEISSQRPSEAEILKILPHFQGDILQIPPVFSALKIGGKRAYLLARQGHEVSLSPRSVYIKDLRLLESTREFATFECTCGKGTYIRSLGRDLAHALGTVGYISSLRRTCVGIFSLKRSISYEKVLELGPQTVLQRGWYSIGEALDDILAIPVSPSQEAKLRCGQGIECHQTALSQNQKVLVTRFDKVPVALAVFKEGRLFPGRVFGVDE